MSSYLQRRGFRYGTIREVIDELWQEMRHET
jgi:SOS response regulatory protein OraA/RecX